MSALPPIADIRPRDQDVRFGPKADIVTVPELGVHNLKLHDSALINLRWEPYLRPMTAVNIENRIGTKDR